MKTKVRMREPDSFTPEGTIRGFSFSRMHTFDHRIVVPRGGGTRDVSKAYGMVKDLST